MSSDAVRPNMMAATVGPDDDAMLATISQPIPRINPQTVQETFVRVMKNAEIMRMASRNVALNASHDFNATIDYNTTAENPKGDGPTVVAPSAATPSAPKTRPDICSTTMPSTTMPPTMESRVETRSTDLPLQDTSGNHLSSAANTKRDIRTMDPSSADFDPHSVRQGELYFEEIITPRGKLYVVVSFDGPIWVSHDIPVRGSTYDMRT